GSWTVLAAEDEEVPLQSSTTSSGSTRARLTTVVLGHMKGTRLATLLRFTFSSRPVPSYLAWTSVEGCDVGGDLTLRKQRPSASGFRTECTELAFSSTPLADSSSATARSKQSLARLNATMAGPALISTLSLSEQRRGFMRMSRFDWPGATLGDAGSRSLQDWYPGGISGANEAYADQLWAWFKDYASRQADGYQNDLSIEDGPIAEFEPASAPMVK
ncbi:MAG TPA: hypothetical protein VGM74_07900, partial [Burkholderiaceae bacterium]